MLREFAFGFLILAAGCRASLGADARMDAELTHGQALETDAQSKEALGRPLSPAEAERAQAASLTEPTPEPLALFGARHDFTIRDGSGAVSCKCVAALLGPPSSGKLTWQGEMPRTKPETQLVVALIPEQGQCATASYWGYRVEGNDVVVLVEDWKAGRPQTLGAIIPKPPANGQVFLAAVSQKLPFGAVGGGARCPLGNPGPKGTGGGVPLESSSEAEKHEPAVD